MPTPARIDRLEPRLCFAAGPTVTSELFVGNDESITAVVIGFDASLDPTSAQTVRNYVIGGSRGSGRNLHDIDVDAAVYDDATRTVTLTMRTPFELTRFKRLKVVVRGEKAGEVTDTLGNLIDGNRDGVAGRDSDTRFKIGRGKSYSYKDTDGDKVSLKVTGAAGRPMTTLIGPDKTVVQVWVRGQNNSLSGTIRQRKRSDGAVDIARVVLGDPSNLSALLSPFSVGQTVIDGQTGITPGLVTLP